MNKINKINKMDIVPQVCIDRLSPRKIIDKCIKKPTKESYTNFIDNIVFILDYNMNMPLMKNEVNSKTKYFKDYQHNINKMCLYTDTIITYLNRKGRGLGIYINYNVINVSTQ